MAHWCLGMVTVLAAALLSCETVLAARPSSGGGGGSVMAGKAEAASLRPAIDPRVSKHQHHRGDEIKSLPGYAGDAFPSKHYGGYITVDEEAGRHLYYYFVESQGDPATDPVVLWLNGGPGCSSFDGFVYEHGPFKMAFRGGKDASGRRTQELELRDNPHTWAQAASVLYVDSPAGVGMSYYEREADRRTDDDRTIADLNTFLRRWFDAYPAFQPNDFFISGESFAGVYVPLLSQAVLDGNDAGQEPQLRLRGYLVGNGVTDPTFDGDALVPFAYGKSLISRELYEEASSACGGAYWNATAGSRCDRALDSVYAAIAGLNIYDVLEPCYHGRNPYKQPSSSSSPDISDLEAEAASLQEAVAAHRGWPLLGGAKEGPVPGFVDLQLGHTPPCLDSREMWAFCNDAAVRRAIHAQPIEAIGSFDECTNGKNIHYTHNRPSMLGVHRDLIARGLYGLVYSGDHDMAVPHTGSEAWTAAVGGELGVERAWAPWFVGKDKQVAGYAVHYKGLVYATVRGAGHMVPETKPAEALEMVRRFLGALRL